MNLFPLVIPSVYLLILIVYVTNPLLETNSDGRIALTLLDDIFYHRPSFIHGRGVYVKQSYGGVWALNLWRYW